jgi:hypothetical protein
MVGILVPDFERSGNAPGFFTILSNSAPFIADRSNRIPETSAELTRFAQFLGFLWAGPIVIALEILLVLSRSLLVKWALQALLIAVSVSLLLAMLTSPFFSIFDYTFSQLTFYTLIAAVLAEILIVFMERSYLSRKLLD